MPNTSQPRKTFKISDSLNRQLNTYAQVAAAAGVSLLALAGSSEAEIVYTKASQVTHSSFPLYIDLNHDGINDFVLRATYYAGSSGFEIGLDATGVGRNRVAGRHIRSSGGYFFLQPPLCRRAPKSGRKAISPCVFHLWQLSISTASTASLIPI